jgi:hypothetical protein
MGALQLDLTISALGGKQGLRGARNIWSKGRKGIGSRSLSTGLDPQHPSEYIDFVYTGKTPTDDRFRL